MANDFFAFHLFLKENTHEFALRTNPYKTMSFPKIDV